MANEITLINGVSKRVVSATVFEYIFPLAIIQTNTGLADVNEQSYKFCGSQSPSAEPIKFKEITDKLGATNIVEYVDALATGGFFFRPAVGTINGNTLGWANYSDDEATNIVVTTTPQQLTINKLGGSTYEGALPKQIRGTGTLWNGTRLTPIAVDDNYDVRIDLEIIAKSGAVSEIDVILDIGATDGVATIPIVNRFIGAAKAVPYNVSIGFPIFCRSTFVANGGQFLIFTDTGTVTIRGRVIFPALNSFFIP